MIAFLRKLFGHQEASQSINDETNLEKFYIDAGPAQQVFEQLITAPNLPKRILVIHGIGGVGKSTLLKMYALTCRKYHIPVAQVASEEVRSPVDVLAKWETDLNQHSITVPTFHKTLSHYRAILAKVEAETKKSHEAVSQIVGAMGKTVTKTAITMAASAIPVVGPLVGALGGESAEAFIDWLGSFLTKPDMELYLDPAKRLASDFLNDLSRTTAGLRIILMTDTYEQMTALDDWMRELARKLPKNVLLVIAGRNVPSWDRSWQDWMGRAEIVELKEMTPDNIRTLVHRYYALIRGGNPEPKQVEDIVEFARGLPMVATTVVQLWVKYGLEDFQTVRPQVVADLVDRLLEGVPQEVRPAFESAAVLRFFNVEALSALLANGNSEALYAELRRWPFIRSRKEGLAVHDTMREMINEALKVRAPERFRGLHERATAYYEAQLEKVTGDERERYVLEQLYHHVYAHEVSGMQLFQEQAEELARYRLVNRLRALLNDVNTYLLGRENSRQWREYYNANLEHLTGKISQAEKTYQSIGENENLEPKLRAYALCDWAIILQRRERLFLPGGQERAIQILEKSISLGIEVDLKLAMSWIGLGDISATRSDWGKASFYFDQAKRFFTERNDYSGLITLLDNERRLYWRQGNLWKTLDIEKEMWHIYTMAGEPPYLRIRISPTWEWALTGRYAEAEKELRIVLDIARSSEDHEYLCRRTRELALYLGFQGKCSEAEATAEEGLSLAHRFGNASETDLYGSLIYYGIVCLKCGKLDEAEKYLTQGISIIQKLYAHLDIAPLYLATVYEILEKFEKAEHFYQLLQAEAHQLERTYNTCAALTGLVRVKLAQSSYMNIQSFWVEAEQLAKKYEYNDHLTSLYLTRGHIVWTDLIPDWKSGFVFALHYYQLALIHALRFNRFLLDEALIGKQSMLLRAIIPHCLERGKEGQSMLVALEDWWQSGNNDNGAPRPDTISPMPEGISLTRAESIARQREPGDGSPQKSLGEQINAALAMANGK